MNLRRYDKNQIRLEPVPDPVFDSELAPVPLEDTTMEERKRKILKRMKECGLDCVIIYEDLEHGGNFEYLTGFLTRFEEALLILHKDGRVFLVLGNENLKMAAYSRIPAKALHFPYFSLPNQPSAHNKTLKALLGEAGIKHGMRAGLCGWKYCEHKDSFEIPYNIVCAVHEIVGDTVENCTGMWIDPENGVRTVNNANEIAHYEFGSALAGKCVNDVVHFIQPGCSEMEAGQYLDAFGQKHNVISICAAGKRFEKANLYPSDKKIQQGDRLSVTAGFCGGLASRAGYAVENEAQLNANVSDYLERVAAPYYGAIAAWLENIHIGMSGGELYRLIDEVLPRKLYHWYLNPGHLCAEEEWLCSPIYENSQILLKSGMIIQIDIIPSVDGYAGAGAENGIALADAALRKDIRKLYPRLWERLERRREYVSNVLHLSCHPEVLFLSDTVGLYRPFFLDKHRAMCLVETVNDIL